MPRERTRPQRGICRPIDASGKGALHQINQPFADKSSYELDIEWGPPDLCEHHVRCRSQIRNGVEQRTVQIDQDGVEPSPVARPRHFVGAGPRHFIRARHYAAASAARIAAIVAT